MTRRDFQRLALMRVREARILLRARQYSGAYYLCGYAVECALKACIAKQTRRYDFPDRPAAERAWSHDLTRLLSASRLQAELERALQSDDVLRQDWTVATEWTEASRYERKSAQDALFLVDAVTDPAHGVLPWFQRHW